MVQHSQEISSSFQAEIPRLLRLKDVLKIIPVSKSAWWQGVKTGRYPSPVKLSPRVTVWKAEDIRSLIDRVAA